MVALMMFLNESPMILSSQVITEAMVGRVCVCETVSDYPVAKVLIHDFAKFASIFL